MNIKSVTPRELADILSGRLSREENTENISYDMSDIGALLRSSGDALFTVSGDRPTDVQLAEHIGGMAKRLDGAYAKGKFTETEYRELCVSLDSYMEDCIRQTVSEKAFRRLQRNSGDDFITGNTGSADFLSVFADRSSQAEEYVKDSLENDKQALMNMIKLIRQGKFLN